MARLSIEEKCARACSALDAVRAETKVLAPGRDVAVLAATKSVDVEIINFLTDNCGLKYIGENRVQELLSKYDRLHREKVKLHFIGNLQTNKVKYIIDKVDMIESVSSLRLAREIDRQAAKYNIKMPVLAEINIGSEESKQGILPEEWEDFWDEFVKLPNLIPSGVMTMAPLLSRPEDYNEYFERACDIFKETVSKRLQNIDKPVLSMGMSSSYRQAVLCGSTEIRVGSAIFGERPYDRIKKAAE
ncbi:MAG TPA: YggS family pyridoxal phosphate-dependent enzyme [Clostridiales bacterium]|jgi:pyridoxal phosphate enzyme (YggS family)|nr:YggS family pyridoxal phosphate-dependent enzyme [Clostridiales bacterium]